MAFHRTAESRTMSNPRTPKERQCCGLGLVELVCSAPVVLEPAHHAPHLLFSMFLRGLTCPKPQNKRNLLPPLARMPRPELSLQDRRDLGQVSQHLLIQRRQRCVRVLGHHLEDLLHNICLTEQHTAHKLVKAADIASTITILLKKTSQNLGGVIFIHLSGLRLSRRGLLGAEEGLQVLHLLLVRLPGLPVRWQELTRQLQELLRRGPGLELLGLALRMVCPKVCDLLAQAPRLHR